MHKAITTILLSALVALIGVSVLVLNEPPRAEAVAMTRANATWYGPGFYGNKFACTGKPGVPARYLQTTRGTAHMWLPCGSIVQICYRRCVLVKVIDRGAFSRSNFDTTAQTNRDLQGCAHYCKSRTLYGVRWRRVR